MLIDAEEFERLSASYKNRTGLSISVTDTEGSVAIGHSGCPCADTSEECRAARKRAVEETARWGEPFLHLCPSAKLLWAVPLMHNARTIGALVVDGIELDGPDNRLKTGVSIREAAWELQRLAEEANLTNASYLEIRRQHSREESRKAEAIHELKDHGYDSIREIYLKEEASILAAIKRGDRNTARNIINRVLVGIYFFGRDRPDLLKSFILELVVTMSRSAVEAGGDPSELLGANYSLVTDLAAMETEEELTRWLVSMLERIMDSIRQHKEYPTSVLLNAALAHMSEHLGDDLCRDQIAAVACLSPSHFSRVVKEKFGRSFTEILTTLRVERAQELLTTSEKTLVQIALECGFADQSYFSKVFQKQTGCSPSEYRHRVRGALR